MTAVYVCARDGTPLGDNTWCPTCQDDTIAVATAAISHDQYLTICRAFTHRGVVNRAERMRRLSKLTGRSVTDYRQLTYTEAANAATTLEEWAYGKRTS